MDNLAEKSVRRIEIMVDVLTVFKMEKQDIEKCNCRTSRDIHEIVVDYVLLIVLVVVFFSIFGII